MSIQQLIYAMSNCRKFGKELVLKHIALDKVAIVKSMTYSNGSISFCVERDGLTMTLSSMSMALMLDNYVIYDLVSRSSTASYDSRSSTASYDLKAAI